MQLKRDKFPFPTWRRLLKAFSSQQTHSSQRQRWVDALKRFGMVGFLFFLIKGLLWLALPLWYFLFRS